MREHIARVHQIVSEGLTQYGEFPLHDPLHAVVQERLARGDRTLPWFMLPILTCEALGGKVELAYHAAAGLEIARIAAGCLDEWQDHDTDDALWQDIGPERTVSLATGMIALSLLSVTHLADLAAEPWLVLALQREFEVTLLHMSAGQYADLDGDLSLDDYETVAGAKSGALFQLGCRAGAMIAGADAEIVTRYGEFGRQLGILAQVWNDILGLAGLQGKNDAQHGHALPVLVARAVGHGPDDADYRPQSVGAQTGDLYTVLELGRLYQRTSETLGKCPAAGRLPAILEQYEPGRLVEMMGLPHLSQAEDQ